MKHAGRIILSAGCLALAVSAGAEEGVADPELAQAAARFNQERRDLIASNLQLTPDEATRFWPLYERYQRAVGVLIERRRASIAEFGENYDEMSEAEAKKFIRDRIELTEQRFRLMKQYYLEFEHALPVKKLARYYQIESKIYFSVEAGIAEEIPLVK
ncbi:hypothetical protein SAMN02949497_4287 [Methylomagnum ishizawai]|uniref:Transcriptional regulator n=1 Tax=Methylomagnum ishizawai TaxID=1760988 RepID=A0A1Y6D7X5_9GAMM|nr:hypothetical protein SAMN02949497_4287 [Methylomagnum ishizawai]